MDFYKKAWARANDFAGVNVEYFLDKKDKPYRLKALSDRIQMADINKRGREIEFGITGNIKHNFLLNQLSYPL